MKGPETASAKFLKVLFSWATKPEDCNCVLTPGRGYHYSDTNACGESAASKNTGKIQDNPHRLLKKYR